MNNVQSAEMCIQLTEERHAKERADMDGRHQKELLEAHTALAEARREAANVLGPWQKNDDHLSDVRAWLKGPALGVPARRRIAAEIYDTTKGFMLLVCLPGEDHRKLNFDRVSLDFVIQAGTAILRAEGWTVLD